MVPDDVLRLGQELGLGIVRMKGMPPSSIHSDMAYAWLMRYDNVPQTSGDPTWRALARALAEMKCQNVIDKIIQSELLVYIAMTNNISLLSRSPISVTTPTTSTS